MRQGKRNHGQRVPYAIALLALLVIVPAGVFAGPASTTGGYLGVYTSDMDAAMLEALDFEEDGILINDVARGTPAEKAGLKAGDIILRVGDRKMVSTKSLKRAMWRLDPGEETTVVYWRDGKEHTVKVTVAEKPERDFGAHVVIRDNDDHTWSWGDTGNWSTKKKSAFLGVELQPLGEQLAAYFGVDEDEGALIESVVEDSPAEKAGLKAGDIILTVAGESIDGPGDVSSAVWDKEPGDEVDVVIMRDKKKQTIKATLGERDSGIYFHPGTVGHLVREMVSDMPDIKVELDEIRGEILDLRNQVKELGD